jgi:drug/metabolite transporter (DMT)-like permease
LYRILGAGLCLSLLALPRWKPVAWKDTPRILLCALTGISGNQLLYLEGLKHTLPVHATLIVTMVPVFTLLVAWILGAEKISLQKVIGILVGFSGVLVLVGQDLKGGGFYGDILVLLNTLLYSIYLVISRPLLARYEPMQIVARIFLWGAPMTFLVTGMPDMQAEPIEWAGMGFIVLGPTVGTYALNLVALQALPPSTVAVFIQLQPFLTALLAWAILHQLPGALTLVAGALSCGGVWLATRAPSTK